MLSSDYDFEKFLTGLSLAISSSLFIGTSFIIKKIALRRIGAAGHTRASSGGFSYLTNWLWWLGLTLMGIGEVANLFAYGFVPAALVTPLGALSVLVTTILASKFLDEKLSIIGKIGCCLCILGSTIFVIHSPKTEELNSFSDLSAKINDHFFLTYVFIIVLMSLILKQVFIPKFGNTNIFVYLLMCSGFGSLTIVSCKAVALGIRETVTGKANNLSSYLFWFLLAVAVFCVMVQMNYLNKSLDIFNTSIVTPVYYVIFTILVIIATGILFKEWQNIDGEDILGCICAFLIVIIGVFMLNMLKDIDMSIRDVNMFLSHRRAVSHSLNEELSCR